MSDPIDGEPASEASHSSPPQGRAPRRRTRRSRTVRESLASIVLGFESVIMFLATLAVFGLKALPWPLALGGGAVLCVLLLATIPFLGRPVGIAVGWVLQGIILGSAILVPLMLIVAILFGGMWVFAVVKGGMIDRNNARLAQQS